MAKGFIFLFLLTTLPNLLPAQNIEDDVSSVALSVTEIRRVNTVSEDSETKDAKIYATQVTIENCTLPKENYTFKLSFIGSDGTSTSDVQNVPLEADAGTVHIIFNMIIPDIATTQLLIATIDEVPKGVWKGKFSINDIKARVAVIDSEYLRVTTGELEKVTIHGRTEMICDNTTSPCYYSRDKFKDFPPVTDRCVNLLSNGIDLKYCDDTVTEFIALSDEPSLILLDEEVLNLRYPTTNNTYEVLMIEKDSLLKKENIFKCSNYETPNIGCNVKISISRTEVTFIITTVDENDFVEGSSTDIFNVIPVDVIQLTEDSVFASWKTDLDPPFDVFIKTKSNLDEFEYRLNATCTSPTENRFESLFINVTKDENHIAVVQQGNNAVAKTITGGVTQLDIYRIYKTEGIIYDLTFMVQTATKNLPTVELIEVNVLDNHVVENQYYSGTVNKTSDEYWFKSSEVTGTLSNERKFYLVEYNESNIPVSCGVTYITFVDVEVELRVVGLNNSIVRTHVFGNKNVTVGNEACDATCTCYTEANEGVDLITICTKIENSAPSGGHLDQCEEMKVSSPSVLEDDPHLLLLDSFDLYLRYDTKTAFEVLALDMEGHIISGNPDFTCAVNKGGCYMKDILPKDSLVVGFTIISVSENGSLSESKDYLFENVHLGAWYLTDDAVITKWTSVYEGMSASIRIWSDPDHNKYSSDVICDSATPCEYFFILPENSDYVAVISSGTNSVAKTITKDLVVESGVKKISKTSDPDVTVFSVERKEKEASSQFDVKLIEVSESGETVKNILHEGTITEQSSTLYEYSTSDDIMKTEGERKFLLMEYSDDQITGVGPVYVTFEDVDVELDVVGLNNSIVRSHVFSNTNVMVGNETCEASHTCYTEAKGGNDLITICTEIENSAPSGGPIDQCEDLKASTPSVLKDDPHLLLLDSSDLYLRYDTKTAFEVLALDMEGHIISGNPDFTCAENDGGCYMKDILPKDSLVVGFTIVSVSEDGSLSESKDYLFENVLLGAWYLTDDAVITKWTSVYEGMSASIRIWSDPDHNKYSSNVICDSATLCEYFFILPENSDYVAVISNGTNSVAKTITKDPVVESRVIKKISKTADPDVTVFSVERKENEASTQFNVKLIEVSESGETVTNILHEGNITEKSSTLYEYSTSDDIMKIEGEKKFLLVEYSNEQITGVGPAYVTFVEFDVELEWMANSKILREIVLDNKNVLIGDEYCNKSVSACYHSTFPDVVEYIPLCSEEVNAAKGTQKNILLCEDQKPGNTEELTVEELHLQEDNDGKISLTSACIENSKHVGLALYSSGIPLDSAESDCSIEDDNTCSVEPLHLSAASAHLDVVVVCISVENVISSSIVPVEDLKFTTKRIGEKSMMVHWTVANADEYVAQLITDKDMSARDGKDLTSKITCDDEDSCYSTFLDIDLKSDYQLIISKEGDTTSFTEKHIDSLNDEKVPDYVNIIKVSRVSDNETKVFLKEECKYEVTILAKLIDGTSSMDISGKGKAVDFTRTSFKFTHSETIFDKESVTFSVLDSEMGTFYHSGIADVALHSFNTAVAWVGAERDTKGASLRVDVGNQNQVELGDLKCEKENSPCYFFEVASSAIPEVLERCVPTEGNAILQCDEEVTPFEAMDTKDVNITLEGNVLFVVAPLSESGSHFEITSYDPSNPATSFSKGNVTCTARARKNTEMLVCQQPVQLKNSPSDIKVIVAEVNGKGKTLKSIASQIIVPSFAVESWVIAVSVLGSLVFVATGSYFIIVCLKKKKLQKWESDAIKKEVKTIDTIGTSNIDPDVSRAGRDSISDSSISLPERRGFSRRSPQPFRRPDNFSGRPFSREIDRFPVKRSGGYPVERGSPNPKSLSPPERRPVNYFKPQPPLGRDNKAFVSSESDGMYNSQPMMLPKVNLASRVNLSSLQHRMSQYQQTRV